MTRLPRDQSVTLELISRQQEQALAEVAALRDEVRVQSAVINRLDAMMGQALNIVTGMLEQMRAMVAQHQRFAEPAEPARLRSSRMALNQRRRSSERNRRPDADD